jgi:hypothetical protein
MGDVPARVPVHEIVYVDFVEQGRIEIRTISGEYSISAFYDYSPVLDSE